MFLDFASGLVKWIDRHSDNARFDLEFFDNPIQAGAFALADSGEQGGDPGCTHPQIKAVLAASIF